MQVPHQVLGTFERNKLYRVGVCLRVSSPHLRSEVEPTRFVIEASDDLGNSFDLLWKSW